MVEWVMVLLFLAVALAAGMLIGYAAGYRRGWRDGIVEDVCEHYGDGYICDACATCGVRRRCREESLR